MGDNHTFDNVAINRSVLSHGITGFSAPRPTHLSLSQFYATFQLCAYIGVLTATAVSIKVCCKSANALILTVVCKSPIPLATNSSC